MSLGHSTGVSPGGNGVFYGFVGIIDPCSRIGALVPKVFTADDGLVDPSKAVDIDAVCKHVHKLDGAALGHSHSALLKQIDRLRRGAGEHHHAAVKTVHGFCPGVQSEQRMADHAFQSLIRRKLRGPAHH